MAETESTDANTFIQFAHEPLKRKRAEAVCIPCHSKKIKCDITRRSQNEHDRCSNCETNDRHCQLRPSQRGKRKNTASSGTSRPSESTRSHDGRTEAVEAERTNYDSTQTNVTGQTTVDDATDTFNLTPVTHDTSRIDFQPQDSSTQNVDPSLGSVENLTGIATGRSHGQDVDAGYLHVYGPENQFDADMQELRAYLSPGRESSDNQPLDFSLQSTFLETYWEYCYCFCPVLDRATVVGEMARSALLTNAVALAASHVQPPLLTHEGPEKYYDRARRIFYEDGETSALTALKALSLFYWWAPRAPTTIHRHTSWWWQSVIIRHAQQMGMHREPPPDSPLRAKLDLSMRRRIWWTAFARERLTALCQSQPCIIDPDDCTISEPQPSDFPNDPESRKKGLVFIHWVRLCGILGRMAKGFCKGVESDMCTLLPKAHRDLANWVQSLPPELQLRLDHSSTASFDRDVHQLHLPYLTAVIILHLKRSAHDLPQALPPAILAASCTARLLRDILARGNTRFLMAITCWYCGTAFIALLQGSRIPQFAKDAEDGINVLTTLVEQLQKMWPSANVIRQGFDRLRRDTPAGAINANQLGLVVPSHLPSLSEGPARTNVETDATSASLSQHDSNWTELLPFVTRSTNSIAECLIDSLQQGNVTRGMPSPANVSFYENVMHEYDDFLAPFVLDQDLFDTPGLSGYPL